MTLDNRHDAIKTESKSIHSKPLSIKNFVNIHHPLFCTDSGETDDDPLLLAFKSSR